MGLLQLSKISEKLTGSRFVIRSKFIPKRWKKTIGDCESAIEKIIKRDKII